MGWEAEHLTEKVSYFEACSTSGALVFWKSSSHYVRMYINVHNNIYGKAIQPTFSSEN